MTGEGTTTDEDAARARHAGGRHLRAVNADDLAAGVAQVPAAVAELAADLRNESPHPQYHRSGTGYSVKTWIRGRPTEKNPDPPPVERVAQVSNFRVKVTDHLLLDDGSGETPEERYRASVLGPGGRTAEVTCRPTELHTDPAGVAARALGAGAGAVVYPMAHAREHLRAAISRDSVGARRSVQYTHLGWRRIGGRWVYLDAAGALGATGRVGGVHVAPPAALERFALPDPIGGRELADALGVVLSALLDLAPPRIVGPLLASVWRAVVLGVDPDLALWLYGGSGLYKSELAALAQSFHGGGMDARHLPAGWTSTANALEALAAAATGSLLVVDDFAPTSARSAEQLAALAERLIRGSANAVGRLRSSVTGDVRAPRVPRALIVVTAEDLAPGQSLRARTIAVHVARGDVSTAALTTAQLLAARGTFAAVHASYVQWLAAQGDRDAAGLRSWWQERAAEHRDRLAGTAGHARIPAQVASLLTALDLAERWAATLNPQPSTFDLDALRAGVVESGAAMGEVVAEHRPGDAFLRLLSAALLGGRGHLEHVGGGRPAHERRWGWTDDPVQPRPQGNRVGWTDGRTAYLLPDLALGAAQEVARASHEPLSASPRRIGHELAAAGLLLERRGSRYTTRITVSGARPDVWAVPVESLGGIGTGVDEDLLPDAEEDL